jgi:predicted metal-dependent phosphoesterase TrpH
MIDLHLHTTASDGELTPIRLVEAAVARGMEAISITDHDTVGGLAEGQKRAQELGIEFINGIELSSEWMGREVHILGYFIDPEDPRLQGELAKIKEARDRRNIKILEKLREYKIDIGLEELHKEAGGEIVGRSLHSFPGLPFPL